MTLGPGSIDKIVLIKPKYLLKPVKGEHDKKGEMTFDSFIITLNTKETYAFQ